ncbi:MAG: sulfatase-like hydrolase/transferase [Planctomycetota bacterium]
MQNTQLALRFALPTVLLAIAPLAPASFATTSAPVTTAATPALAGTPGIGDYNVLVIMLDDLGTDRLQMYRENLTAGITPNLDTLWARGIQFTNAYVNPVCSPSRAALMTGRYGFRTGIGVQINEGDPNPYGLPDEELFASELLRDATAGAYACGAFGKWHLSVATGDDCHAGANGFERYRVQVGNVSNHYRWTQIVEDVNDPRDCAQVDYPLPGETDPYSTNTWNASVARKDAVDWIKNELPAGQPFFAYYAPNPPHMPQQVPPNELLSRDSRLTLLDVGYAPGDFPTRRHKKLVHEYMIEAVDSDIGLLLDPSVGIPQNVLDDTMVIVIGDNGTEALMVESPQDPRHAKRTLYQLGVRVPMVVAGPLVQPQHYASKCHALVDGVDVWRTAGRIAGLSDTDIDDYVDAEFPGVSHPIDGLSLLDLIDDPTIAGPRAHAYSESFPNGAPPPGQSGHARMVSNGTYKYIRKATYPDEELYDVATDPDETDDILTHGSLTTDETAALCELRAKMKSLSGGQGCVGPHQPGFGRVRK